MSKQLNSRAKQTADRFSEVDALIEKAFKSSATELNLSNRGLTKLPESIRRLSKLRNLDLDHNDLMTLPEWIGELTQLTMLAASHNRLTYIPESVSDLAQLRSMWFGNNQLKQLPAWLGRLHEIRYLYFNKNQLTELPPSLSQLPHLINLSLWSNQLTQLPGWIGELKQLHHLDVSDNPLKQLPAALGRLTNLKELEVRKIQLTELPDSLSSLTQLEEFNLTHNNLTALPEWIRNFKSLRSLYLHGNDALDLPSEILGRLWFEADDQKAMPANPGEIIEYYFRVRGGKRPLNEAKLILVGRGGMGKTSLVNRLVHDNFASGEKKTEGIKITEWSLRLKNSEDVRLNVWDFGGQEITHATHQFFLTQRSLYLLVLNGREGGEDADADYWLKLIESFGGDSPVIIVLNKIKEHPFDVNRRALQQKYPAVRDFIKTDCEDGTGLAQLRDAIERETDRLEHLRDAFPASWFTIKDQLASMKENYLSFDEFRDFCSEHNECDATAQEILAVHLHSLGIALNYKDDPRLQDTHVLNPHWVTNGIYKILFSEKLEQQKGEIGLGDLSGILDREQYPTAMHRFLFDLMKKFDLCFSFPGDDARYLIPELLDKQEAPEAAEFDPQECLNFQYHYPVLPEGLLPRFIVRTHTLSDGLPRWRTGVILKFEDNRALVKADVQDKKVFISVSGPTAGRRRLLAIIRSDFERIHYDIRNLQPQEIIPLPENPNVVVPYQKLLVMEQNGIRSFPEVVGDGVSELNVHDLLNGVDLEGTRRKDKRMEERREVVRLFYSYSHKDEMLRDELETHLKLMQRQGLIDTWHDRKIEAGDDWKRSIDDNLNRADIILLLVSSDFIASNYCYEKEMARALERHKSGEALVIPLIVRDVNWGKAPFTGLQVLPKDGKAVTLWDNKDSAWRNISEGIEKVVERIRKP
jgi:internalin A